MSVRNSSKLILHPERGNAGLKVIDRYFGIPLVMLLGLARRKRRLLSGSEVRKTAFLQTAAIGDTVLLSAIVQDFKAAYPNSNISIFTGSSNYEAARLIPGVDNIVKVSIKDPLKAIKKIREAGYFDVWFDCGPWPRLNAILTFFAHAAIKIGFHTYKQHRHYVYDTAVHHSSELHELENYRRLIQAFNVPAGSRMPVLSTARSSGSSGKVVLHMFPGGARSYLKEWPSERWVALIDRLVAMDYAVYLTGATVDRDRALAIRQRSGKKEQVSVVAGMQTLQETAELIGSSDLVVSVDTGIMHMASALGCNLVALHGPTSPKRWGPLNPNAVVLCSKSPCSPCISLGFESRCDDPKCMRESDTEAVISAARQLLKR